MEVASSVLVLDDWGDPESGFYAWGLLNLDCVLMVDDLSCTFETHIGGRPYNPVSFSCWVHSNFHNNEYTKRCAAVK